MPVFQIKTLKKIRLPEPRAKGIRKK